MGGIRFYVEHTGESCPWWVYSHKPCEDEPNIDQEIAQCYTEDEAEMIAEALEKQADHEDGIEHQKMVAATLVDAVDNAEKVGAYQSMQDRTTLSVLAASAGMTTDELIKQMESRDA